MPNKRAAGKQIFSLWMDGELREQIFEIARWETGGNASELVENWMVEKVAGFMRSGRKLGHGQGKISK